MKDKIVKPYIECRYTYYNVFGIPYCSMSDEQKIECPFLSDRKIKSGRYSSIDGYRTIEFRVCEFKFEADRFK